MDDPKIIDAEFEVIKGPDPVEPMRPATTKPQWREDVLALIGILALAPIIWVINKVMVQLGSLTLQLMGM